MLTRVVAQHVARREVFASEEVSGEVENRSHMRGRDPGEIIVILGAGSDASRRGRLRRAERAQEQRRETDRGVVVGQVELLVGRV